MKKFLAILMAMMLVFSLCGVAMADGGNTDDSKNPTETESSNPAPQTTPKTYTDVSSVTVTKNYKLEGSGESPAETFSFSDLECIEVTDAASGVTKDNAPVPTIGSVEYETGDAGSTDMTKKITITLPTYASVGKYTYTFTENAGKTAGVTYHSGTIKLVVTVLQYENKVRVAAVHTESSGDKIDYFDNTYSASSLSVKKEVKGILGDKSKEFKATVTFTAPTGKTVNSVISYTDDGTAKTIAANAWTNGVATADITLKDGETVTFNNIPYGVTYSVAEDSYTTDGYTTTYASTDTDSIINSTTGVTTTITNTKDGEVDTGVYTDNMPYIMLMGIVVLAGAVMLMKRRSYNG